MNLKQQKFAEYYAQSGNATQSAECAGYSLQTAYSQGQRLLKNVEVSAYIQELSRQEQNERIINAKERQVLLSDIARNENNTAAERIKAIDTLNKMTGEYVAKVQANVKPSEKLCDVFAQLSPCERKQLAGLEE